MREEVDIGTKEGAQKLKAALLQGERVSAKFIKKHVDLALQELTEGDRNVRRLLLVAKGYAQAKIDGVSINKLDEHGLAPIHYLAALDSQSSLWNHWCEKLLELGADPWTESSGGRLSAFDIAQEKAPKNMLWLRVMGSRLHPARVNDVGSKDGRTTVLHLLAQCDNPNAPRVIAEFLALGANPMAVTDKGETAFDLAKKASKAVLTIPTVKGTMANNIKVFLGEAAFAEIVIRLIAGAKGISVEKARSLASHILKYPSFLVLPLPPGVPVSATMLGLSCAATAGDPEQMLGYLARSTCVRKGADIGQRVGGREGALLCVMMACMVADMVAEPNMEELTPLLFFNIARWVTSITLSDNLADLLVQDVRSMARKWGNELPPFMVGSLEMLATLYSLSLVADLLPPTGVVGHYYLAANPLVFAAVATGGAVVAIRNNAGNPRNLGNTGTKLAVAVMVTCYVAGSVVAFLDTDQNRILPQDQCPTDPSTFLTNALFALPAVAAGTKQAIEWIRGIW